jgi:hypothetical protein
MAVGSGSSVASMAGTVDHRRVLGSGDSITAVEQADVRLTRGSVVSRDWYERVLATDHGGAV